MPFTRKKLIEVSIPLEAINSASAREKSIRYGHPSTLHLWWARRPLAACRAILFAQLVDDPSSWPDRFPTNDDQERERKRLHKVVADMMPWEAMSEPALVNAARFEIARSVAWGLGKEPPSKDDPGAVLEFLQTRALPVYDPFSGGGSIPLEAQRLGLRAYGSDINPVAVLIGKALVDIPPRLAGMPAINPDAFRELSRGGRSNGKGALGLADDVRYYGRWLCQKAIQQIGDLYPLAELPDGSKAQVIAWLWARTVRSPDPAARGAMVPLVSSFLLAAKDRRKAWVEPVLDPEARDGYRFIVRTGTLSKVDEERIRKGTKTARGNFACLLTGAAISEEWNRAEGKAGRLGTRLMAVVADGKSGRRYLSPDPLQEATADDAPFLWEPDGELYPKALGFRVPGYGLTRWADLFTKRQMATLASFFDLLAEVHEVVLNDAGKAVAGDDTPLSSGGAGPRAYADAIVTYLALAVNRCVMGGNTLVRWNPVGEKAQHAFGRQALPMVWDFAETNLLGEATGSLVSGYEMVANGLLFANEGHGEIFHADAASDASRPISAVISTDPPYYDNVGYADLSDFFYVWLRPALKKIWPDMLRRLATPKNEELVATPHRHGGKANAETFFMNGMRVALQKIRSTAADEVPVCIYYAFKQSEVATDGITSAGWSSFLQSIVDSCFVIDGTWPLRTEMATRMRGQESNALASSIVLVCRKRAADAPTATRSEFVRALKRELPDAIESIRRAGVGPVDMQQSVIGPGMGVFSRHAKVIEDDDSAMTVKTALALINRVWEEIENELDAAFDPETQVALAWFATYGFGVRPSGELITLANAKAIPSNALFASAVFRDLHGRTCLTPREELPSDWNPADDPTITIWRCLQQTARTLLAEQGGAEPAARLVAELGPKSEDARKLAHRLFEIAKNKGWASEALVYNQLAEEWTHLEDMGAGTPEGSSRAAQGTFAFDEETA